MGATARNLGGGVLGFAIAFLASAFGGALGLPESVRLIVIGAGVLLAVLSAGMRGFGLAALVLGGVVLLSSITLLGALGVGRVLKVPASHPTPLTTPPPQEDGGYILTLYDKEFTEAWWSLASTAEHRMLCASVGDGVTNAETKYWVRGVESEGFPVREGGDWKGRARAMLEYMGTTYC
ncbi:MAG TPA: hypothetical protein VJ774_04400 [Actinomycetota bacterium]|nr:hypothetical protein [Actinomycetota bacterium]